MVDSRHIVKLISKARRIKRSSHLIDNFMNYMYIYVFHVQVIKCLSVMVVGDVFSWSNIGTANGYDPSTFLCG